MNKIKPIKAIIDKIRSGKKGPVIIDIGKIKINKFKKFINL